MFTDQTAKKFFGGQLQSNGTNISSNLNPFAKEFYPTSVKSRNLLAEEKANLVIKQPELKTCEILQGPAVEMAKVFSRLKGLMHIIHRPSVHLKTCDNRHVSVLLKSSKALKPELQKSLHHIEKIKKPPIIGFGTRQSSSVPSCKIPSAPRRNISSGRQTTVPSPQRNISSGRQQAAGPSPRRNTSSGRQQAAAQAPKAASSSIAIKSKVMSKYMSLSKETATKSPYKDCLSIRSGSSSIKSCPSLEATSSHHFDGKKDKTVSFRSSLQTHASSKTVKPTEKTSKGKTVAFATPRGTVASTLRKTETQKRRNLFPYDPVLNIKMSEFLFK